MARWYRTVVVAVLLLVVAHAQSTSGSSGPTACQRCCGLVAGSGESDTESASPGGSAESAALKTKGRKAHWCRQAFQGGPAHCCGTYDGTAFCCPTSAKCHAATQVPSWSTTSTTSSWRCRGPRPTKANTHANDKDADHYWGWFALACVAFGVWRAVNEPKRKPNEAGRPGDDDHDGGYWSGGDSGGDVDFDAEN